MYYRSPMPDPQPRGDRPAFPPLPTTDPLTGEPFRMDLKAVKEAAQRTAGKLHVTPIL